MKRALCLTLTMLMLFSLIPAAYAEAPFTDVQQGSWYYANVQICYLNGWMNGVSDTEFDPDGTMTRAMLVTVLHRAVGKPATSGSNPFTDVSAGSYYADAVAWAYANNVVNGTSATTFSPNQNITRQDLVTILYRYAKTTEYPLEAAADLTSFSDAGDIAAYAKDAMGWAVAEAFVNGVGNNLLEPKGNSTRAQCAKLIVCYKQWENNEQWELEQKETEETEPTTEATEPTDYPTPEEFGSALTQADLDALEQYARDYAYETYGYDGNPNCLPENGAGYFPATKWTITSLDRFYDLMEECVETQYLNDIGGERTIWKNKDDGSIFRRKINIVIEPLGKDYYRVHTYYGGHAEPFHQDYWKELDPPDTQPDEPADEPSTEPTEPHEHDWQFAHYTGAESIDDDPKFCVYVCSTCGERKETDFATDPEWGLGG